MRAKAILLNVLTNLLLLPCYGQMFEGVITMNISTPEEKLSVLTVKGRKTMLENQVDSMLNIKLIQDRETGTTVILKQKEDLKYGFRSKRDVVEDLPASQETFDNVAVNVTDQRRTIGAYDCFKVEVRTDELVAEAWVTKDLDFSLTTYFPEFLEGNMTWDSFVSKGAVNREGFILYYSEKETSTGAEFKYEVMVEEKEIASSVFLAEADYTVLDEVSFRSLYIESLSDDQKKRQWEEFMQLFGRK